MCTAALACTWFAEYRVLPSVHTRVFGHGDQAGHRTLCTSVCRHLLPVCRYPLPVYCVCPAVFAQVFSVLTAVLAVSALVGCITARASSSWQLAHGAASSQMLASNLNRCCQEKPTDAPNPPDPTKADTLTAHKVGKILGLSGSQPVAAVMKNRMQTLQAASPEPLKFSKALYSVDFVHGMAWTPSSTRDSPEATTIAKIENGVTTPEALRHAAATKHFNFGSEDAKCKGTALVFIQWDNSNIADFIFRATVLDAFFSQFDKASQLKAGTLAASIDTVIIWAGLISWSEQFLKLIVPHSEVITRKQLGAEKSDRCWANGFFFTDNTPQVGPLHRTLHWLPLQCLCMTCICLQLTLWAKPMQNFRTSILSGLKANTSPVAGKPQTAMIINKGSGIRQVSSLLDCAA